MIRYVRRGKPHERAIEGVPAWLSEILYNRGVDTEQKAQRFLRPLLSDLHDPFQMQDMDCAVRLIRDAAKNGDRVVVYGDYDVDGVCATTIMLETLRDLGIDASYYIPSRHAEGYGLNRQAVSRLSGDFRLLITVDCGISSVEEVDLARQRGMRVIVTDHHQLPPDLPKADAVLNPLLGAYPFRRLCGAGVALKITQALLGMEGVLRRIDLAALATVADIVTLIDENRIIVAEGMKHMDAGERPGIRALCQCASVTLPMTSTQIAFRLAPRINAGGRMEDASQCVELLLTGDEETARRIAEHLEENNQRRRKEQDEITEQALGMVETCVDFYDDRAIVVMGDGWNRGVIGLVAGKICEKFHMPTIVLTREGADATGSCRSVPGVNIYDMLRKCEGDLHHFGGHEQAAGLTMPAEKVDAFRKHLNRAIQENCDAGCMIPVCEYDDVLPLSEVTLERCEALKILEPCGFGNPSPRFLIENAHVDMARPVGKDGQHLQLTLRQGTDYVKGIAFSQGAFAATGVVCVDAVACPGENEYHGYRSPQLQVESLQMARSAEALPSEERFFLPWLQEIRTCVAKEDAFRDSQPNVAACSVNFVREQLLAEGGVLLLAHTRKQAEFWLQAAEMDVGVGRIPNLRGFTSLAVSPPLESLPDVFHSVVFLDDTCLQERAGLIRTSCRRARLYCLEGIGSFWEYIHISRDAIGKVYQNLPLQEEGLYAYCRRTQQSPMQALLVLAVLDEAGLVRVSEDGMHASRVILTQEEKEKKTHRPSNSALYQYIQRTQSHGKEDGYVHSI